MKVKLTAEPEAIEFDPEKSAIVVVDMQNYDIAPGGLFDLTGVDTTHGRNVIEPIKAVLGCARSSNMPVIYTKNVLPRDRLLWPNEDSPWYWKSSRREMHADPSLQQTMAIEGNWGGEIVEELSPTDGDFVIQKTCYSSFVNTDFDLVLRRKGIRYLFLTGIGTPTCVDATARDAYFHEYWPIVISDCCGAILPETHEQALAAIKRRYGWVTRSADLFAALLMHEPET